MLPTIVRHPLQQDAIFTIIVYHPLTPEMMLNKLLPDLYKQGPR